MSKTVLGSVCGSLRHGYRAPGLICCLDPCTIQKKKIPVGGQEYFRSPGTQCQPGCASSHPAVYDFFIILFPVVPIKKIIQRVTGQRGCGYAQLVLFLGLKLPTCTVSRSHRSKLSKAKPRCVSLTVWVNSGATEVSFNLFDPFHKVSWTRCVAGWAFPLRVCGV